MPVMTDEDKALSEAIVDAVQAKDRALVVQRLKAFYGDPDRCDRAPRRLLVLHLGLVTGLLETEDQPRPSTKLPANVRRCPVCQQLTCGTPQKKGSSTPCDHDIYPEGGG